MTAGGDCPGLNAAIRAIVRRASADNSTILGLRNGWRGLIENDCVALTNSSVIDILGRGGTILGTSRFNPLKDQESLIRFKENWHANELDGLIVIGGEGSLSAARDLWRDHQVQVLGIPKTIDNDISGTDFCLGFYTAVSTVTDAVDRCYSTAESHHRVMVVEVMGRHTGWIAAYGGIAGGADIILVPEQPFRLSRICDKLTAGKKDRRVFSIIVVAEDAHPHPDENFLTEDEGTAIYRHHQLGGIGEALGREIERRTGIETRVTKLGYIQRGGSPTPFDRILATRFGIKAYQMAHDGQWGRMVAVRGNRVTSVPLDEAVSELKHLVAGGMLSFDDMALVEALERMHVLL